MDEPTNLYAISVTVSVTASYFEMLYFQMFEAILLWLVLMSRQKSWGGRNALDRHSIRYITLRRMIFDSDLVCVENTRMNRRAFYNLCDLLSSVGRLRCDGSISVEEAVAIFLNILAHDEKNRVIKRQFVRSGESISRQFRNVLNAVIRCHNILLKKPTPIPEDSTDERWKWFKTILPLAKNPNCQVKATPHISSRVKLWKKQYHELSEMLGPNASGFGWNDIEKRIICEKDVFDNWVKWSVVFGKDRANGLGAESLADAVEDIDREEATNEGRGRNVEIDMNNNLDNEELDDNPIDEGQSNSSPIQRTDSSVSKGTRKRRISSTDSLNESIAKIICSMENKFGTANDNIAKLAGCFQFMADDAVKMMEWLQRLIKYKAYLY